MTYELKLPSQEELLGLGLAAVPDDMDKSENAFVHQIITATSIIGHELLIQAEYVHNKQFLDQLTGSDLDVYVYDRTGLKRKAAEPAKGKVRFTGGAGVYVPLGTLVGNGEVTFQTVYGQPIGDGGSVEIDVVATVAGNLGYFPTGAISQLLSPVPGVTDVTNNAPIQNGYDIEPDAHFRARYRLYFADYPTTNNPAQFRTWALEVSGVGQARIKRAPNGPGTVGVIVLNEQYQAADAGLLNRVKAHITERMGFDVKTLEVNAPVVVKININAVLTLMNGYEDSAVKASIAEGVRKQLSWHPDPTYVRRRVSYWDIATIVKQTEGVKDIVSLSVNGATANVELTEDEVAEMGVIV